MSSSVKVLLRGLVTACVVVGICGGVFWHYRRQSYEDSLRCVGLVAQTRHPELPPDTCARDVAHLSPKTANPFDRYVDPGRMAQVRTFSQLRVGPTIYASVKKLRADQRAQAWWSEASGVSAGFIAILTLAPLFWFFLLNRIRDMGRAWRDEN